MTAFLATTWVDVFRGVDEDIWGDATDVATPHAFYVPCAVTEVSQRSWQGTEHRGGLVEQYLIRFRPGADICEGDRLLERPDASAFRTGRVFHVDAISTPDRVVGIPDVRATARRIAATSKAVNA